jgi:hypothetical protein
MPDKDKETKDAPENANAKPVPEGEDGHGEVSVDEDWKAEVKREQEKLDAKLKEKREKESKEQAAPHELPAPDFMQFISGIAAQTLMQLGDIENPYEGKKTVNLEAARYSIDLIAMLEEKTKGNLSPDEERYVKSAVHDLRMRFVEAAGAKPETAEAEPDASGGEKA